MMSASQREHIRDSLRRQLREATRDEILSSQRQGKRTHSESSVSFSKDATTATTPPRKQRGRATDHNPDDDDNDDDDDFPTINYTNEEAVRDCDRLVSLTSKLARVDHHIDSLKQCFDSNVIPTGNTIIVN